MVSNIGFGAEATHTSGLASKLANIPAHDVEFPLRHPPAIEPSAAFEDAYYRTLIRKSFPERLRNFFRRGKKRLRRMGIMRAPAVPAH
jgi:hypothetical protein